MFRSIQKHQNICETFLKNNNYNKILIHDWLINMLKNKV